MCEKGTRMKWTQNNEANNESEQIMKLIHRIHICLIIFLIHCFDIMNSLKSDKPHYMLTQ